MMSPNRRGPAKELHTAHAAGLLFLLATILALLLLLITATVTCARLGCDVERLVVPAAQILVDVGVDGLLLGERADELVDREGLARQPLDPPRSERPLDHVDDRAARVVLRDAAERLQLVRVGRLDAHLLEHRRPQHLSRVVVGPRQVEDLGEKILERRKVLGLVHHVRLVGRADNDDAVLGLEQRRRLALALEQRFEELGDPIGRLASAALDLARLEHPLCLVNPYNRRRQRLGHLQHRVHHVVRLLARVLAVRVGRRQVEQVGARLVRDCVHEHLLACAVRAKHQHGRRILGRRLILLGVDPRVQRRVLLDGRRAKRQHAELGHGGTDLLDRRVGQFLRFGLC
mmetsp:Transcript_55763/g.153386  ORF Transcript_55763/g.153386 Transcript_55763/m.153386 type:complete len:345 (-) Transcript_55763:189-1223(-)